MGKITRIDAKGRATIDRRLAGRFFEIVENIDGRITLEERVLQPVSSLPQEVQDEITKNTGAQKLN